MISLCKAAKQLSFTYFKVTSNKYTVSKASVSHNIMSLLVLLIPAVPIFGPEPDILPTQVLPTLFHLWSLQPRSFLYDFQCLDVVSSMVSDSIASPFVTYTKYGLLTSEQLSVTFTSILRLLEVPVSYVGSPYVSSSETVSYRGDKDGKRSRSAGSIASLMVYSLSGELCLQQDGILDRMESLFHSVETFCHPSNHGSWTKNIIQTVTMLVDFFLLRWNIQHQNESLIPKERYLTDKVKDRFVLALREISFLAIHSKSGTTVNSSLEALQGLAYLSPHLIIPRLLNEVYPSLQGLVETHRTLSSLKILTSLARIIARHKRYAIHLSTLLGLAIPGIDANDLSKTLHSLTFIQAVALNVPFRDISNGSGLGITMEYISADISALEENQNLPEYGQELLDDILKSSTASFGEFIISFLGRIFTLLENIPDPSASKSRDLPEAHIVNTLPSTMTALLGAVSDEYYELIINHVVDFVANNVIHSATDAMAHMCGCLVKVRPDLAFPKLFAVFYANIKQEVLENGAGSIRSSEILPRDRALIWNLSALNMALAHAGSVTLDFKDEIMDITVFLRSHCRGAVIYHISNAVHHALMTLTSYFNTDYSLSDEDSLEWGRKVDPRQLEFHWHVPNRAEIEFAVQLYTTHINMSLQNIADVMVKDDDKKMSVTELSDIISANVTYIRTTVSGLALLFDAHYESNAEATASSLPSEAEEAIEDEESDSETESGDNMMELDSGDEDMMEELDIIGDDVDIDIEGDVREMKKLREYPVGYLLYRKQDDPLYNKIHDLRIAVGSALHDLHIFLTKKKDNDILSFKALLFAYKVWFSDVGIERSAKVLDSAIALYTYETKHFRISGLRKDYPRSVLARRAGLFHIERLVHNSGPRVMTDLERTMLFDVMKSAMSIYPDIRRNAHSALESAVKVLVRSRPLILPWVLKEVVSALQNEEFSRAESGLRIIHMRIMQSSVKRDFKHVITYIDVLKDAMKADYPSLNAIASPLYNYFASNFRLLLDITNIDLETVEAIKPTNMISAQEKIQKLETKKAEKRKLAEQVVNTLVEHLLETKGQGEIHWKLMAVNAGLYSSICSSPQVPVNADVLIQLTEGALSPHPGVKAICMHALFRITTKAFQLAGSSYDYSRFLINCDEDSILPPNSQYIESDNFKEKFLSEMNNFDHSNFYVDKARVGWLVWPDKFIAETTNYKNILEFNEQDELEVRKYAQIMTKEWLDKVIQRLLEEPRVEDDYFEVTSAIFFKIILRLVGLKYTPLNLDELLESLKVAYKADDKNSHRCVAEICSALTDSLKFSSPEDYDKKVNVLVYLLNEVLNSSLASENLEYWKSYIWWSSIYIDYRRSWPVSKLFNDFRVSSSTSSSSFKDTLRATLLRKSITCVGWHYQPVDDIIKNFWDHIDHNLQGMRDEIAKTLGTIYMTRYIESYASSEKLLQVNLESGSLGASTYFMSDTLAGYVINAFERLERYRLERETTIHDTNLNGNSNGSRYILTGKTLITWLEKLFKTSYSVSLVPLLPKVILPALLHFLNVRDEQELMVSCVSLFKSLGNIPYPYQYISLMIDTIVDLSSGTGTTWHQRMNLLTYMQAFYFRQLFMMNSEQRLKLVATVSDLLSDVQLEVRDTAAETLAGMIRCSPVKEQVHLTETLQLKFTRVLAETSYIKTLKRSNGSGTSSPASQISTPIRSQTSTPVNEYQILQIKRHSAALGLGALVKAFPYQSPPPEWVPKALQTLANKAASDPGMVGKSVKITLGDFKKTRQDTWHIDNKVFTQEQLEDLEGVLWKNYFV